MLYDELYLAYKECLKNKGNTLSALNFKANAVNNLKKLCKSLENKTYKPGRSICFIVTKPKPREIFAADFRDRIVHHFLIRRIKPYFYKDLTVYPQACIEKRGTHHAITKVKEFIADQTIKNDQLSIKNEQLRIKNSQITNLPTAKKYYLQVDIRSFFSTIDKDILFKIVAPYCKDDLTLYLAKTIIYHNPTKNYIYKGDPSLRAKIPYGKSLFDLMPNKGLPIGNYTSQFFANMYLHSLDCFIGNFYGVKQYLRYVDDLLLVHEDKEFLKFLNYEINEYLQVFLKQSLAPEKTNLKDVRCGIDFLGYFIKPHYTLARKRVKKAFCEKVAAIKKNALINLNSGKPELSAKDISVIASYLGHFKYCNAKNLIQTCLNLDFHD